MPVIAGAVAVNNSQKAQRATDIGIRLAVILSLPCGVIMYTLSSEILSTLFHNDTSAQILTVVAPCVVMMCVTQISGAILQSAGKIMLPFFYALIGSAIKLSIEWFLIADPEIHIYGSAIGSTAAYTVIMVLNLLAVKKHLGLKQKFMEIMIKPVIAAAVMFAAIRLLYLPVTAYTGGGFIALALLCAVSCAAYAAVLLVTDAVSVREIKKILKG